MHEPFVSIAAAPIFALSERRVKDSRDQPEVLTVDEIMKLIEELKKEYHITGPYVPYKELIMASIWQGEWRSRIDARLKARGFDSATAFAKARPLASLLSLAEALGRDDVAAIQIETLLRDEARRTRTMSWFARDLLVRCLHESIPDGWGVSDRYDAQVEEAMAYGHWTGAFFDNDRPIARRAYQELLKQPIPRGWLPSAPDDPLLLRAFEGVEFPSDA